jgi:uncharacterized protein YhdP
LVDQKAGLDLRLTQIESKVEELDLQKPLDLEIRAAFLHDKQNITMRGRFGPVGQGPDVENLAVETSLQIDPIEIEALSEKLPIIKQSMPVGLKISGPVSVGIEAKGTPVDMALSIRIDATQAMVNLPQAFRKTGGVPLAITADAQLTQQEVTIQRFDVNFHNLEAAGKGHYDLDRPTIDLSVDTGPTSLGEWNEMIPAMKPYNLSGNVKLSARIAGELGPGALPDINGIITVSDVAASVPQLIKPISQASSEITFSGQQAKVASTSLMIGSSQINGSATIESFEPLIVDYQANSTTFALDDLRPPNPKAKKPEVLQNIVVRGRMVVDKEPTNHGEMTSSGGSIGNIDFQNLEAKYAIVGRETRLNELKVQTLDGAINGSGVITMNDDVPTFDFKTEARDLNVIALIDKLPNVTRQFLRGKADMNLNISGTGKEWPDIQKTISGQGIAQLFDGAIIDFNLFDNVVAQLTDITGNPNLISQGLKDKYPKVFKDRSTEFKDLKSDFVIEDGKLLARNLNLNADEYNVRAKGAVDFGRNLDLSVTLLLSKGLTADLIKDFKAASYLVNSGGQIEIPFALVGTLPKARAELDKDYVNKVIEKALVQKGFDLFEKQDLGKDVKDLFDFGKKKKESAPADTTSGQ